MAIFDSVLDMITLVTPVRPKAGMDARAAYAMASERLADVVSDLDRPLGAVREQIADLDALPEPESNMSPADYMAMVRTAREYITAGALSNESGEVTGREGECQYGWIA